MRRKTKLHQFPALKQDRPHKGFRGQNLTPGHSQSSEQIKTQLYQHRTPGKKPYPLCGCNPTAKTMPGQKKQLKSGRSCAVSSSFVPTQREPGPLRSSLRHDRQKSHNPERRGVLGTGRALSLFSLRLCCSTRHRYEFSHAEARRAPGKNNSRQRGHTKAACPSAAAA